MEKNDANTFNRYQNKKIMNLTGNYFGDWSKDVNEP